MLKGKYIFLIEDDPVNFSVIRTILIGKGAIVPLDHWGDITLKQMKLCPPLDLIIIDLMLPGNVTGYDVFEAIKKDPELKNIPTVVVSASDPDIEIPKAREKGFNGFISKPINRHKFPQQLLDIMNGENIWGE